MIRKLTLLAAMALAAMAVTASSAAAQGVHTGGSVTLTGNQWQLVAHSPMGEAVGWQCTNDWSGEISEDGHVNLYDVQIAEPGSLPICGPINDCADAGFEGQITEVAGGFQVHTEFCLEGTAIGTNISGEVTCSINTVELHCADATVENQSPPPGTGGVVPQFEWNGELDVSGLRELEHA